MYGKGDLRLHIAASDHPIGGVLVCPLVAFKLGSLRPQSLNHVTQKTRILESGGIIGRAFWDAQL